MGAHYASEFEEGMEAVLNDPVYKGRFTVNIVYLEEETLPKGFK